jgi:hypothetical protein
VIDSDDDNDLLYGSGTLVDNTRQLIIPKMVLQRRLRDSNAMFSSNVMQRSQEEEEMNIFCKEYQSSIVRDKSKLTDLQEARLKNKRNRSQAAVRGCT